MKTAVERSYFRFDGHRGSRGSISTEIWERREKASQANEQLKDKQKVNRQVLTPSSSIQSKPSMFWAQKEGDPAVTARKRKH